ncbi:hypothetical protein TorRG33x02_271680 [Trema orientale]|uniref:Uncharacterized protein n=1 Tax=Trema orientale TaxID=63057 RepID=A0A2P5CVN7_TREOI|nr:hypothetical protein TorRG33x02_271680 [Trema orientale]
MESELEVLEQSESEWEVENSVFTSELHSFWSKFETPTGEKSPRRCCLMYSSFETSFMAAMPETKSSLRLNFR